MGRETAAADEEIEEQVDDVDAVGEADPPAGEADTETKDETEPDGDEEEQETGGDEEEDDGEVVVTVGDEEPPEDDTHAEAPEWVKNLRKSQRELQKENRDLKLQLEQNQQTETKPVELGPKPTLKDFNYDDTAYESELSAWYEKKRQADQEKAVKEQAAEAEKEAWNKKLGHYNESKQKLKVQHYEDAEAVVMDTLSGTQQGIIIQGADNPALLIYAIGMNPARAAELAEITDPVTFAFTVSKLEKDLKVKNRKAPPPPEKAVSGTGPKSGTVDSTLERLRAEAEKTGDYTKVTRYKREKRKKS